MITQRAAAVEWNIPEPRRQGVFATEDRGRESPLRSPEDDVWILITDIGH